MKLAKRLMVRHSGGVSDPYWDNVVLCINAAGADGSTSITDAKGNALTLYGNTQIDTSLGYPTIEYDGDGDTISVANSSGLVLGSDNHTVEMWLYCGSFATVGGANRCLMAKGVNTSTGFAFLLNTSGNVLWHNTTTRFTTSSPLPLNTICHFSFTYTGGVLRAFIDGVAAGSATIAINLASTASMYIGSSLSTAGWFLGKMPAVRITKGVARWTSAFTPPPFPFPAS